MKNTRFAALLIVGVALASTATSAGCIGSGALQTCTDSYGNSYTVQRFGAQTMMQGQNYRTGSQWSQNSMTFGNTTVHNGYTNGRSWHMNEQRIGNYRHLNGTNSSGQSFSYSCGPYGCN